MISSRGCGIQSAIIVFLLIWDILFQSAHAITNDTSENDVMKVITKRCVIQYSVTCFKLDLLTVIDKLSSKTDFHIYSGITLTRIPVEDEKYDNDLPRKLAISLVRENFTDDTNLDVHLFHKVGNFLRSIHLSFPLVNDFFLQKITHLFGVDSVDNGILNVNTGRRRLRARWIRWLVSVVYALAFGLLAGLVSKSLLMSIIALTLSLAARFGNFDFIRGSSMRNNYEIIAQPIPQVQHLNTHSSEIKYEDEGVHSSSNPGVTYVYPRTIPHIDKVLAFHHLANLQKHLYSEKSNADTLAYKGFIRETTRK